MKPLSASQISTFLSCQRAWSFAYIDGIRSPNTPSTLLGSSIHKEMEDWSKLAKAPQSPQAKLLMGFAPPPGVASTEHPINLVTPNSTWRGFIDDAHDLDEVGTPVKLFTTGHTVVIDWKTSGNLSYAKSAQHLAEEDPAAALYAQYAFSKGAKRVSGKWVYVTTKGRLQTRPVLFDFDREKVQKTVDSLDETAAVVQKLYTLRKKTAELPQSLEHCSAFGGCFHRETCYKSPMAQSKDNTMSGDFEKFISERFPVQPPPAPPLPPIYQGAGPEAPLPPPAVATPEMIKATQAQVPPPPVTAADLRTQIPPTSLAYEGAENPDPDARAKAFIAAIPPPPSFQKAPVDSKGFSTAGQKFDTGTGAPLDLNDGRPEVEHGFVNSPEGPRFAPASPEEAAQVTPVVQKGETLPPDELDTLDRDTLKKLNISLGLCTESSRFQEPRLRANVREFAQTKCLSISDAIITARQQTGQAVVDAMTKGAYTQAMTDEFSEAQAAIQNEINASRVTLENTQLTEEELSAIQTAVASEMTSPTLIDEIRLVIREEIRAYFAERFGK